MIQEFAIVGFLSTQILKLSGYTSVAGFSGGMELSYLLELLDPRLSPDFEVLAILAVRSFGRSGDCDFESALSLCPADCDFFRREDVANLELLETMLDCFYI